MDRRKLPIPTDGGSRVTPQLDSVLPLLDLMAANHAIRSGIKIPLSLKRAIDHRHRVLARRHPKPSRLPKGAKQRLLAGIPEPPEETRAQHEAEWLGRAKDVIVRYK